MISYPFEKFWLEKIGAQNYELRVLEKFEPIIQALSDHFTVNRPKHFKDYTEEENLLAYGLFFFPQTFTRVQFPLDEILNLLQWKPLENKKLRILDVGSGLGAGGISLIWKLREHFDVPIEYHAYDHSPQALQYLLEHEKDFLPKNVQLTTEVGDLKNLFKRFKGEEPWDIILFSFSLNEGLRNANESEIERYLEQTVRLLDTNGFLLCLEPVLKEKTNILQKTVEALHSKKKAHLWAPGFGTAYPGQDLPHDVRCWNPPESLKILNRKLFRSIEFLKYHFFVLGKEPLTPLTQKGPETCRLISPMIEAKGRFLWEGWGSDGTLYHYDLLTRDINKIELERIQKMERGNILSLKNLEPQKLKNYYRVLQSEGLNLYSQPL